jgi:acyl transferase domain-containing protein
VYVGICNNDYDAVLREQVVEMTFEGQTYDDIVDTVGAIAYSTYAFASNRVSHMLGLVGASLSIDCASASALVATHMAASEARQGRGKDLRCLAASVNLILHHHLTDLHTARSMFPGDGRCKTFDASADGFERGEGAGAVLMRPAAEVLARSATTDEVGTSSLHHFICGVNRLTSHVTTRFK